ncbi:MULTISPECIES: deoxyhypusine synthase family protein [unclassified Spirulina]|uniref:deoxyhypusine synthase family protein n=1 Tax=unclassified Spirulina TaxID=2684457 RepID=UPI0019517184|nr:MULTISPECIES: deoxyhypusine synthase family protein [Spirulina]MEA5470552.1 deoxyhypusine synthase family protein [Spirulina sp. 06S082]
MNTTDSFLKELEPLNLQKCYSVSDIVEAMSYCSFGARMLGETTTKIYEWIVTNKAPIAIYDGNLDSPLGQLLQEMSARKWFTKIVAPKDYTRPVFGGENAIVIGAYSESVAENIYSTPKEAIFLNQFAMVKPGQTTDGYFPNVIFSDPNFLLPVIFITLEERLRDRKSSITDLMKILAHYEGLAAEVSSGSQTLRAMIQDPDCLVFLTLSGAMTIAKMGLIICDLIDMKAVQAVCSTGALMAHGLVESVGLKHFKYNPQKDDANLAKLKMNRVTDTLEPEDNLEHIKTILDRILDEYTHLKPIGTRYFHQIVGEHLAKEYSGQRGILKSAYEQNVPVIVPAFVDSEIGNDIYIYNRMCEQTGRSRIVFDLELDTQYLVEMMTNVKKTGIFTVGGGVPRNYIQNLAPLVELLNGYKDFNLPERKLSYGCRICPDPMHYGHLSGCSYSEGMSWRKMETRGMFSEVHADATLILPFLVKFLMESRELT